MEVYTDYLRLSFYRLSFYDDAARHGIYSLANMSRVRSGARITRVTTPAGRVTTPAGLYIDDAWLDSVVPDEDIAKKYILSGRKPQSASDLLLPFGRRHIEYYSDEEIADSKKRAAIAQIRKDLDLYAPTEVSSMGGGGGSAISRVSGINFDGPAVITPSGAPSRAVWHLPPFDSLSEEEKKNPSSELISNIIIAVDQRELPDARYGALLRSWHERRTGRAIPPPPASARPPSISEVKEPGGPSSVDQPIPSTPEERAPVNEPPIPGSDYSADQRDRYSKDVAKKLFLEYDSDPRLASDIHMEWDRRMRQLDAKTLKELKNQGDKLLVDIERQRRHRSGSLRPPTEAKGSPDESKVAEPTSENEYFGQVRARFEALDAVTPQEAREMYASWRKYMSKASAGRNLAEIQANGEKYYQRILRVNRTRMELDEEFKYPDDPRRANYEAIKKWAETQRKYFSKYDPANPEGAFDEWFYGAYKIAGPDATLDEFKPIADKEYGRMTAMPPRSTPSTDPESIRRDEIAAQIQALHGTYQPSFNALGVNSGEAYREWISAIGARSTDYRGADGAIDFNRYRQISADEFDKIWKKYSQGEKPLIEPKEAPQPGELPPYRGGGVVEGEVPEGEVKRPGSEGPPPPPPPRGGFEERPAREPGGEEKERERKRNEPFPPPQPRRRPGDQPRRPGDPPQPGEEDKGNNYEVQPRPKLVGVSYLRPSFVVGGQDVLLLTEKERIEEIEEWDLFDLPIPDADDPDNPLHSLQSRQNAFRFALRPPDLFTEGVKPLISPPAELVALMEPVMMPQLEREQLGAGVFWDANLRAPYNMPTQPDRTSLSVVDDMLMRSGSIFSDIPHILG